MVKNVCVVQEALLHRMNMKALVFHVDTMLEN